MTSLRPILSSSAPARPGAQSRRGSARIRRCACSCSRPAARTAIAGSTFHSVLARPSPTPRSIGATRPSPIPAPGIAAYSGRAARCSAVPRRSTAWSISAARPKISTTGGSSAIPAGRSMTYSPISDARSTRCAAPTGSTAPTDRSVCRMSRNTRSVRLLSRRRPGSAFPAMAISTAPARTASVITRRRHATESAAPPPSAISARQCNAPTSMSSPGR